MTGLLKRLAAAALIIGTPSLVAPTSSGAAVSPLIVNGDVSTIANRPYQIALLDIRFGSDSYHRFRCGGSVVAPKIIITAGHCTFDSLQSAIPTSPSNLRILVNTASLLSGGQIVRVKTIDRHPDYHPDVDATINDIAVLHLTTAVTAPSVAVIPSQSDYRAKPGSTTASVSGWGCFQATTDCRSLSNYPTTLRAANVPLHTNSVCTAIFDELNVGFDSSASLCAGKFDFSVRAPGPCFGDSGGPLTIDGIGGADQLIGVVSWGVKCGVTPVAYTRISTYRSWLIGVGVPVKLAPFGSTSGPTINPSSQPRSGDFDGDGNGDLLAYVTGSGPDQIYRGGAGPLFTVGSTASIFGTYKPIPCDTNEDAKIDLVLYGPGSSLDRAIFGAAEPGSFTAAPTVPINGRYEPLAGDFNGDSFCDILLYGPGVAPDHLLIGDGAAGFSSVPITAITGRYAPVVGDWNSDNVDDIYWFSRNGTSHQWNGGVGGFVSANTVSRPGAYEPIAGDFDGNGYSDVMLYGPGTTPDVLWTSTSTGFHQQFDVSVNGTYNHVATDVDGDGTTEIIWVRASGATSIWSWAL